MKNRKKSWKRILTEWSIMAVAGTAGLAISAGVMAVMVPVWRILLNFNEIIAKTVALVLFIGVDIAVTYILYDSIFNRVYPGDKE